MSLWLRIRSAASRGCELAGRATRQSRAAKRHRGAFYERMWRDAAAAIGATVEPIGGELLLVRRGDVATKLFRNYTELDGPVTLRAVGNKPWVHATLRRCGLPTPEFATFNLRDMQPARDFLAQHQRCVVKPASGTGAGQGVTTGVTTGRQLTAASVAASGFDSRLVIEQQVSGDNFRLLFLDGELLAAVDRQPPTAMGDGRSTIRTLVSQLNERRAANGFDIAQATLKCDLDMRRTLAQQDLSLRSVPDSGCPVVLKTVINENAAADNVCVFDRVACDVVNAGRAAARAVGARLAGVDILTSDVTRGLAETGGVVLEVNTTPGLYIHYGHAVGAADQTGSPVAVPILEACLEHARRQASCDREVFEDGSFAGDSCDGGACDGGAREARRAGKTHSERARSEPNAEQANAENVPGKPPTNQSIRETVHAES